MSFLTLDKVEKTYPDGTRAVKGIDLVIGAGEFIVLLGPSGCGKTTTLRMIAGLEIATGGTIRLDGADVTTRRAAERDVGFVFQFYALYPHLNVRENILFPLRCVGMNRAECDRRLDAVVDRLGLRSLLKRRPAQLGGGDQQRVSLARAMIRQPKIYLMDEPLGTMDADRRLEMREFIRAQQLDMKVTTVYVTHDQEEAMSLADRVVVMQDGLIRQVGDPLTVYDDPADLFVAHFVGSPGMNFLTGGRLVRNEAGDRSFAAATVGDGNGSDGEAIRIPVPGTPEPGLCTLGIRPEAVLLDDAGPLRGRVVMAEYLGSGWCLHVDTPCGRIVARTGAGTAERRRVGEAVGLSFEPGRIRLFGEDGGRRR